MSEHLASLIRSELTNMGAPIPIISEWQQRFEQRPPEEWEPLLNELKGLYDGKFDSAGKLASFVRAAKFSVISARKQDVVELPEEVMHALRAALESSHQFLLIKNESKMTYSEVTDALAEICNSQLNIAASTQKPATWRLPFLITQSDTIEGQVTSQALSSKRSIPLVTVWASNETVTYQFFGQAAPKGMKKVAQNLEEFYLYKMRTNSNQEAYLFSTDELGIVPSRIVGMRVNATDFIKVGEMAKLSSSTPCYFVHTQYPEIREISDEEFQSHVKNFDMEAISQKVFGAYRQPPWFEKLIVAWMFSSKFSGYPLHLAVLSPAGVGKTFMLEGLAALTRESVASGSNDTIRGLIPSFGNGIAREGYLSICRRFAFLDEFFAMIKKSNRQSSSETDSGTYMMLELLEHKQREARSGVGSIKVNPRMKVLLIANSKAYNKLRTLVEVAEELNYAFVSRFLWYCLTPTHKSFIQERKAKVALLDRETSSPTYDPSFIEIIDYLNRVPSKGIDTDKLSEIAIKFRPLIPQELAEKIYDPRVDHHLITLIDGFSKLNSILEKRPEICVLPSDYEEVEKVFGDMVISWCAEVDLRALPQANRVSYLTDRQKRIFDIIAGAPGISTPDLNMNHGAASGEICRMLEELDIVKSSLDVDNNTKLWYPYWYRL